LVLFNDLGNTGLQKSNLIRQLHAQVDTALSLFVLPIKYQIHMTDSFDIKQLLHNHNLWATGIKLDQLYDHMIRLRDTLMMLWTKVLDVTELDIDDDFEVMGGDSIKTAELYALVEKHLQFQIPLMDFLRLRTIREMSHWLADISASSHHLKFIQPMSIQDPSLEPLFFFHNPHGVAVTYQRIVEGLSTKRSIFAVVFNINESGWSAPLSAYQVIQDYVNDIQKIQAHGPYYLAGSSLGGRLALEAAVLLRKQGEEVKLCCLMDTGLITKNRQSNEMKQMKEKNALQLMLDELKQKSLIEQTKIIIRKVHTLLRTIIAPRYFENQTRKMTNHRLKHKIAFSMHDINFVTRTFLQFPLIDYYDFKITYFHAMKADNYDSYLLLKERSKDIELVSFDFDHADFTEENAFETAQRLNQYIT
jgi:thioesterase domain-containing protein/acyl carrier protein